MGGRSAPLGVPPDSSRRGEAELVLGRGAGLLLYTDGLIERRHEPIDAAIGRLVDTVAALAGTPPDRLVDTLAGELLDDDDGNDDVCVLLLTRR
jgi:hypothetical protein